MDKDFEYAYAWGLSSYIDKATKEAVKNYVNIDVASLYPVDMTASSYTKRPMLKLEQFCIANDIEISYAMSIKEEYLCFLHRPTKKQYKFKLYTNPVDHIEDWLISQLDAEFGISDPFAVLKNFCIFNSIEFDISKISYSTVYELYFYKYGKRKVYSLDTRDAHLRKRILEIIDELQKEMLFMLPRNITCDFDRDVLPVVPVSNNYLPEIKKVIFNNPATIVYWNDGSKTVVKCQDGDTFDKEKGLALAICKKAIGTNKSKSNFNDIFKKWCNSED